LWFGHFVLSATKYHFVLLPAVVTDVRTFLTKMDEEDVRALTHNIRLLKEQFKDDETPKAAWR
jgi:hypothetical protein